MTMIRTVRAAAIVAAVSCAGLATANDPCPTCNKGVSPTLLPKPACDNKIFPLSELHYYKRYCAPVISPNATYGYFATQWRPWDGGTTHAGCAATIVTPIADPQKVTAPEAPAPGNIPNVKPDAKPMTPPAPPKESIPQPKTAERGKGILKRFGTAAPISPGVSLVPTTGGQ